MTSKERAVGAAKECLSVWLSEGGDLLDPIAETLVATLMGCNDKMPAKVCKAMSLRTGAPYDSGAKLLEMAISDVKSGAFPK